MTIGLSKSKGTQAAASVSLNEIGNIVDAHSAGATVTAAGNVIITASDTSSITALAGGVTALGQRPRRRIRDNEITNTVSAHIDGGK